MRTVSPNGLVREVTHRGTCIAYPNDVGGFYWIAETTDPTVNHGDSCSSVEAGMTSGLRWLMQQPITDAAQRGGKE